MHLGSSLILWLTAWVMFTIDSREDLSSMGITNVTIDSREFLSIMGNVTINSIGQGSSKEM